MLRKWTVCACVLALLASAADAGPLPASGLDSDDEGWFYNRPGATLADVEMDQASCTSFGLSAMPPPPEANDAVTAQVAAQQVAQYGAAGAVGAVIAVALMAAAQEGPRKAITDDCMIGRGYRRFRTEDRNLAAFTARFETMSAETRAALVGSETPPEGVLARQWVNSYWIQREGDAAPTETPRSVPVIVASLSRMREWDSLSDRDLNDRDPIEVGQNEAIVVVTLNSRGRATLRFTRESNVDGFADLAPEEGRRQPTPYIEPQLRLSPNNGDGIARRLVSPRTFVYVVPAGIYSLAAAGAGRGTTDFCLGAPYVVVQPGSAVFLGYIDLLATRREPDPRAPAVPFGIHISVQELEGARAALVRHQEWATRLEAATYQNGFARACEGDDIYGLDVPGARWEPRRGFAIENKPASGVSALIGDPALAPAADQFTPRTQEPAESPEQIHHGPDPS